MVLLRDGGARGAAVVGGRAVGVSRRAGRALLALVLMLAVALMAAAPVRSACADDGPTLTDSVTDPGNLLGASASKVTDAIARTRREDGVHVRLLYLSAFDLAKGQNADEWAREVLESTDPKPNTVLLAVASGDGSLVVAVSSDSDAWLRSRSTVDALSDAALGPLQRRGEQDWAGAALSMMDKIDEEHASAASPAASRIGVWVLCGALGALVVAIVVAIPVRRTLARRRRGRRRHARR